MKYIRKILEKVDWGKAYYILLLCISFTLPFPIQINSFFVILFALSWLLEGEFLSDFKATLKSNLAIALLLFYILHVATFLYGINKNLSSELELKSSLLLFPVVLSGKKIKVNYVFNLLKAFVLSCFITSLYAIVSAFLKLIPANETYKGMVWSQIDWAYFSYILPSQVNFHAPYFALYISIAIFITIFLITCNKLKKWSLIYSLLLGYFIFFNALLSSRTALFSTIFIITVGVIIYYTIKKKIAYAIIGVSLITYVSFLIYSSMPYLFSKVNDNAGVTERYIMWTVGMKVFKENLLLGVGAGNVKDKLFIEYQKNNSYSNIDSQFDPHNQYINTSVELGIVGLISFVSCLLVALITAYRQKNYLYLAFIVLFSLCSITESTLGTQKGVMLFSFFVTLFAFQWPSILRYKDSLSELYG
jgi:O-antigen ligase